VKWQGVVKARGVLPSGEKGYMDVRTHFYPLADLPDADGLTGVTIYLREDAERLEALAALQGEGKAER